MQKKADVVCRQQVLFLSGELDFSNVMSIYQKSLADIEQQPALQVDFSGLMSSNSASFALLVEWMKLAKRQNKPTHFSHLPAKLMSIAKAAGMDHLIV